MVKVRHNWTKIFAMDNLSSSHRRLMRRCTDWHINSPNKTPQIDMQCVTQWEWADVVLIGDKPETHL